MNRRLLATRVASKLRLTPLLERFASRPGLAVLVYHRINSPVGFAYDKAVIEATPEDFDDQMGMLRKHHDVAGPEELFELVENPHKVKSFRVGITFDDGYLDNYEVAFPILKSHGLSATFFLPTHYIGSGHLPWWDQVAFLVRRTERTELVLDYPKRLVVKVDRRDVDAAIVTVLRAYTRAENVELAPYLAAVERACGASLPAEAEERQFMSWDEAAEMQRAGMAIGSHTHSHNILATLPTEDQEEECRGSRAPAGEVAGRRVARVPGRQAHLVLARHHALRQGSGLSLRVHQLRRRESSRAHRPVRCKAHRDELRRRHVADAAAPRAHCRLPTTSMVT